MQRGCRPPLDSRRSAPLPVGTVLFVRSLLTPYYFCTPSPQLISSPRVILHRHGRGATPLRSQESDLQTRTRDRGTLHGTRARRLSIGPNSSSIVSPLGSGFAARLRALRCPLPGRC